MALRVVIVAPWGDRLGGAEEMLWLILSNCDRERIEPTVAFLGPGPFVGEVAGLGLETEVISAARLRHPVTTLRTIRRLAGVLRRRQPDLVIHWSAKTHLYGGLAATGVGMADRVVWWQHQVPAGHWIDRLATLVPARAIGCSSGASQVAQAALRPRRASFVVNPGIDIRAGRAEISPTRLKARLGIPPERLVVGIVGRLQPWKGQDRFLAALAELRRRGRDVHGLVVGGDAYGLSPEYAKSLDGLVRRLGLADAVTMTGQVADPRPYLALMDVAVNASELEPFGIVLIEAMAAGVPTIAVDRGGPRDIVEDGVTGILVASGESGMLAEAMDDLIVHPDCRAAMGVEAQRRCRSRFTAEQMVDRLTDELVELADG